MKESKEIKHYIKNNILDLEEVINDYSAYVETIINNMVKYNLSNEDKEEICSDVFFILWKNTNKLDLSKSLSPYIAGISRNLVKEYLRKNKSFADISDYENDLYGKNEIDSFDESTEQINKIEKILNTFKVIDKKIFIDYYYSSKSIKDIANEQNITEFSVKQRLYRIRKKIRKEVKR